MKALKFIGIGLGVLVLILVAVGFMLPRQVSLERSIEIARPPCTVFSQIDDWRRFNAWSPWANLDPEGTDYTYTEPASGVGAQMSWTSEDPQVGTGSQTFLVVEPCTAADIQLDFGQGAPALATHRLESTDSGTRITWGLESDMGAGPVGRYFGLMIGNMVGPFYERGLADLKVIVEQLPEADFEGVEVQETDAPALTWAFVDVEGDTSPQNMGPALEAAYARINAALSAAAIEPQGAPISTWLPVGDASLRAGIPVAPGSSLPADGDVTIGSFAGGAVIETHHTGSWEYLPQLHAPVLAWAAAHGVTLEDRPWTQYLSNPTTTPDDQREARIRWRITEDS